MVDPALTPWPWARLWMARVAVVAGLREVLGRDACHGDFLAGTGTRSRRISQPQLDAISLASASASTV